MKEKVKSAEDEDLRLIYILLIICRATEAAEQLCVCSDVEYLSGIDLCGLL